MVSLELVNIFLLIDCVVLSTRRIYRTGIYDRPRIEFRKIGRENIFHYSEDSVNVEQSNQSSQALQRLPISRIFDG